MGQSVSRSASQSVNYRIVVVMFFSHIVTIIICRSSYFLLRLLYVYHHQCCLSNCFAVPSHHRSLPHLFSQAMALGCEPCDYCGFLVPYEIPRHFRRVPQGCSCRRLYYCDRVCQKRHWKEAHRDCCIYPSFAILATTWKLPDRVERHILSFAKRDLLPPRRGSWRRL